ncbi:MAG: hypothetical protein A2312_00695 [Candidatus Staskawiczbacteria bacterium RIFOXYB2_FULL_32_9]|uniref:Nicotinamide mononucleotide transporter PnuC n=1 Tax=Candidatus Staskawiczbacteria bacterium RIFOXYD1_FULL_32_13 TaxID=1802234 RepID=A0A1G2JMM6_9BACT|nr:MAG: hypothetical protein UR22_C0004G0012 [Parcubacteria group bacterium GW2011_GWC2_32_10]OGZ79289.1 MAG: hypothetical protein A2360_01190 [Candidatus Staskawiczbacteria bacterium RIFOXYB1_FULL_32_11]OGZ79830.1 MAG: hypothetical protein A2256_02615 [Candidatus Staskawiczbacteria bacterium RIFOXYA2_FULL_32_7]OGZ84595.1 MAG: hypothetical protein A2312_00695 [Candidatus Staskawiczbacteria bacterium RIFOXYB2_FULL_32_9]OGZ88032.1 MAG: hypothetical protein A2463_00275 [Candidatus Staskawiczbacter
MDWDFISQIALSILSISAIILVSKKNKWGFVVGFLSQPFWIITSYINKQWGVFFISVIYTFVWAFGIYEWFYKTDKVKKDENK